MSNNHQKNKVLLIEDNPGDARLIEILLKESDLSDFDIVKKESLKEGFEVLDEDSNFEAVLLDLSLPDSSGFTTLEKFLAKHPNHNIIVLTGFSDKSMGVKAVKAGAQDFLVKGMFDAEELSKSLRFSMQRSGILNRLEETQRVARIGNWECNKEISKFEASKEVFRIFEAEELLGKVKPDDLIDSKHPLHALEGIQQQTSILQSVRKDLQLTLKDGSIRYAFVQCEVVDGIFYGIIQDITDRKRTEKEMMESRERYQEIFSQSKDAIFIASLDGKLTDCNIATEKLFSVSKDALKSLEDIHIHFSPPEKRNEFLLKLKTLKSVTDFEIEIARSEGEPRHCLISANLLHDRDFQGYNAIIRDITEQKRTEELVKARDLAEESAKLKESFMASISHEMLTPMNAIFGMSNLLDQTNLDAEQKGFVKSINQSSEILLGIINDILEISTIQNGKMVFEHTSFNLHDLLFNVVNVMQYKAKEKDLFLALEIAEDIPKMLMGDKLRINQIFFNLVGNAVKFTDEGYVKIIVEKISAFEGGVHLKFVVEDTGIGIPKEKLETIFESFSRVRSKERIFEGTGLGLSIAKSLVEQQGGKIGVDSKFGEGSKFFFDMIFEVSESQEDLVPDAAKKICPDMAFDLLLVEDHKMNQLVARKTLQKKWQNINITIAENGNEAIEWLNKKTFDIILMDMQMPIMDGMETTKYIRTEMPPQIAQMPILAMTAHAHISQDGKYKELGMDDFVLKPFEPEQLFQKIATHLKKEKTVN